MRMIQVNQAKIPRALSKQANSTEEDQMQKSALPVKTREYDQHPLIDGKRWQAITVRPDDIIISTSYKAGTTWMQTIVANLLYQDGKFPGALTTLGPWLDMNGPPLEPTAAGLEAQTNRRYIKTHLPLDGFEYHAEPKHIVVGRDARDVFMSMWNHHSKYTEQMKSEMTAFAKDIGRDFKLDYDDIRTFWKDWITTAWFEWENDGYPYWSHLHHIQSWWDYRHLPNMAFVHYGDLLADPESEIRRLAAFLKIELQEEYVPDILDRISFKSMKANFESIMAGSENVWKGGSDAFMNKGTNGRWRDVLTADDLKLYDEAVARAMTLDAAHWLENGGPVEG